MVEPLTVSGLALGDATSGDDAEIAGYGRGTQRSVKGIAQRHILAAGNRNGTCKSIAAVSYGNVMTAAGGQRGCAGYGQRPRSG